MRPLKIKNNLKLILILAMFLLVLPLVFAGNISNLNEAAYAKFHFFNASHSNATPVFEGVPTGTLFSASESCLNKTTGCFATTAIGNYTDVTNIQMGYLQNLTLPRASNSHSWHTCFNITDVTKLNVLFDSTGTNDNYIFSVSATDFRANWFTSNNSQWSTDTDLGLVSNRWYCVAATFNNSGDAKIYLDGVLKSTTAMTTGTLAPTSTRVGSSGITARDFVGVIQGFYFFNRTLTTDEILFLNKTRILADGEPAAATDACSYGGTGNFVINTDTSNCQVTTAQNLGGNSIIITGGKSVDILAKISNFARIVVNAGATLVCRATGGCFG